MNVVQITIADIDRVFELQTALAIADELIERGESVALNGLLVAGHTREDLERYLSSDGRVYGAYESNDLIGYIFVASPASFTPKYRKASVTWVDVEQRNVSREMIEANRYVYLDQIGVHWKYHNKGVSTALLEYVETMCRDETIIALVMTSPIDNVRSRKFFEKQGYTKICDIAFPTYGTITNFEGILVSKRVG